MTTADPKTHGLPPELLSALEAAGITSFTPIQEQCLPLLRAGRDVCGESQTGSGKTLAFALPLLEKVNTSGRMLQALVLCPTRELVEQVARNIRTAGRFKKDLLVTQLVGGEQLHLQQRALRHGVHVVVGTPGRILDLIERKDLNLGTVQTLVLDEADRMLDMGFREAIETILGTLPKSRQTALFSATYPPTMEALCARYMRNPERVTVETTPEERPAIRQFVFRVDEKSRVSTVQRVLREGAFESVVVFCNFKESVDGLTVALRKAGLRADKIHGGLEQSDRTRVMARFRNGTTRVLVATDVAARGLDIAGLDAVVNYELVNDPAIHVHRIGRTGRAGKSGTAISFCDVREAAKLERIEQFTQTKLERVSTLPQSELAPVQLAEWETLEIGAGRKDKLRPGDILGALTGEGAKLPGTSVGKIDVQDHVAFVAVERSSAVPALAALQRGKIKGRRFPVARLGAY